MANILIADDDIHILELVSIHLTEAGHHVFQAKDGTDALEIVNEEACDLAVIDIMMPFMNGYTLTKEIRNKYDIPIILLTAKGQIEDKEEGFSSGADDYLVKPFEPKELTFRIDALLRRYNKSFYESIIYLNHTAINQNNYEVQIGEQTFLLPLKEFELLSFLASNPMKAFSREHLIEQIWGTDFEGDDRTVDVHVKRLRDRFSKITNDFRIKTVRGVGYLLEVGNK